MILIILLRLNNKINILKYQNAIKWNQVILVNMDDYLGFTPEHAQSYAYYLKKKLITPLGITKYYFLNNLLCNRESQIDRCLMSYEKKIYQLGGIDFVVHGIGVNGHLGFNEPGSSFHSKTRIVDLTESTIQANSRFFSTIDDPPQKGITLGLKILLQARRNLLLVSGEKKHWAFQKSIFEPVNTQVPASILQRCSNVKVILDKPAWNGIRYDNKILQPILT